MNPSLEDLEAEASGPRRGMQVPEPIQRFVGNVGGGLAQAAQPWINIAKYPGEVFQRGMAGDVPSTEEMVPWAAQTAQATAGLSAPFAAPGAVGAAGGRLFTPQDDVTPGAHPVVVISYAYWQQRFASNPSVVGKQVTINNTPMTIIGVTQEGFIGALMGVMRKVHINKFETGQGWRNCSEFPVWEFTTKTGTMRAGIMICYDREVPESARLLMLQGADVIFNPLACTCPTDDIHRCLLRTRAFENEMPILVVNHAAPRDVWEASPCSWSGFAVSPVASRGGAPTA